MRIRTIPAFNGVLSLTWLFICKRKLFKILGRHRTIGTLFLIHDLNALICVIQDAMLRYVIVCYGTKLNTWCILNFMSNFIWKIG